MKQELLAPCGISVICLLFSTIGWALILFDYRADAAVEFLGLPPFIMAAALGPKWRRLGELAKVERDLFVLTICATALSTIPQFIYWLV